MLCWRFPALYNIGSHLPFIYASSDLSTEQGLTSHLTHYRSFRRRSSQPITWLILTKLNTTITNNNTETWTQQLLTQYKTIKSRHKRELNKSWRDSVYHSQWNIRRSTEGQFTRQEKTTLAQIRTGHCVLLKAYRKRIGLEDDGLCETCKIKEEDREHLLGKCRGVRSDGKHLGRRSCPTGNLSRRIPCISLPSCGGLAGFQPTTGGATQQQQLTQ